jgi:uncharacterized phage protein (TIGR01671 family)
VYQASRESQPQRLHTTASTKNDQRRKKRPNESYITGAKVMNRVIKFRAWHKGQMFNNVNVINGAYAVEENPEKEGLNVLVNGVGYYSDWACHRVYHDSPLMQYTGIKDKEGVEIYEGDIAIDKDGLHFTVGIGGYFSKESAGNGVHYYQIGEKDYWAIEANSFNKETNFKVIGNIYENPELLEADK